MNNTLFESSEIPITPPSNPTSSAGHARIAKGGRVAVLSFNIAACAKATGHTMVF